MKQRKQEPTTTTKIRNRHHKQKLRPNTPKGFRKEIGNLDRYDNIVREQIRTGKRKVRKVNVEKE